MPGSCERALQCGGCQAIFWRSCPRTDYRTETACRKSAFLLTLVPQPLRTLLAMVCAQATRAAHATRALARPPLCSARVHRPPMATPELPYQRQCAAFGGAMAGLPLGRCPTEDCPQRAPTSKLAMRWCWRSPLRDTAPYFLPSLIATLRCCCWCTSHGPTIVLLTVASSLLPSLWSRVAPHSGALLEDCPRPGGPRKLATDMRIQKEGTLRSTSVRARLQQQLTNKPTTLALGERMGPHGFGRDTQP